MSNIESFLLSQRERITNNEDPEGKCDDWNSQLADALSEIGLRATVIADPNITLMGKNGREIGHHAIAVAFSEENNQWAAIDLSSPQIQGVEKTFFARRATLDELAQAVRGMYGGNWKALNNESALMEDINRREKVMESRRKLKK
ncbi:hypothetical protein KJZ63_00055 [Patescibacteria group bacterium]|nr:hypothetical protein [Patescibacteria group bacterium]